MGTMPIKQEDTVLFIGDSITDAGRHRDRPDHLGSGYALMAAGAFASRYPELGVQFYNRGIGGDRVKDLLSRWQADCIDLKPNWVSVYIGINDVWRKFDNNDPTSAEQFAEGYRSLLEWTRRELDAGLVLIEPFVLPVPEDRKTWRDDLDPKIRVVRELATEFGARYVALDGLFAEAAAEAPAAFWAPDGVHPSPAGHARIAQAWLRVMGA